MPFRRFKATLFIGVVLDRKRDLTRREAVGHIEAAFGDYHLRLLRLGFLFFASNPLATSLTFSVVDSSFCASTGEPAQMQALVPLSYCSHSIYRI